MTVAIKDGLEWMVELLLQHGLEVQDDDIAYAIKEGNDVIVEMVDPVGKYREEQRIKKEEKKKKNKKRKAKSDEDPAKKRMKLPVR